ncbi:MAG TPA: diguanylate cyclase, partial [Nitrospiria bacterium]|nr:diguanylate cyclase [Nitrospiria bacterium]
MTRKEKELSGHFPIQFYAAALVVTGFVLLVLGGNTYRSFHTTQMTQEQDFRLQELRSEIVYLDEVLTMSARMAAVTGDLRWEERYRNLEPQLDATIKQAIALAPISKEAVAQTDAANIKLVQMEHLAFSLVRQGRLEEASTVLFSEEYEVQKQVYAKGMDQFGKASSPHLLVQDLRGVITYLDEVLTMSAWMAAATGDLRWEQRYRSFEPQLDAAIQRAKDLAPSGREALAQTDTAHTKLMQMENLVFALVRQDRPKEARALLTSKEYERQKQIYAEGMARFSAMLKDQADALLSWERKKVFLSIVTVIIVLPVLLFAWLAVLGILRKWQRALLKSEARFGGILDIANEAVISIDETQRIIIFNKGAEQIFGYSQDEVVGQSLDILLPEKVQTLHRAHIAGFASSATISRRMGERGGIYGRRKNGEEFPAEASISKLEEEGKNIFTVVLRDITERKRAEEALEKQAIRDSLTDLYNRRYFNYRMVEEIARADRNGHTLAILLCDLDRFKSVNDTRGHHAGDEVLKAVAQGIQEATRGADLVFRWGGDEIVVVLYDTTREGVLIAGERIRKAIRTISEQAKLDLDLSIGVALYPEHGGSVDNLIRLADRALYIAKKGGDKIHIGEEEYQLDEHSINVVFQPVVDIRSDEILGYEALSRDAQGKLSILDFF